MNRFETDPTGPIQVRLTVADWPKYGGGWCIHRRDLAKALDQDSYSNLVNLFETASQEVRAAQECLLMFDAANEEYARLCALYPPEIPTGPPPPGSNWLTLSELSRFEKPVTWIAARAREAFVRKLHLAATCLKEMADHAGPYEPAMRPLCEKILGREFLGLKDIRDSLEHQEDRVRFQDKRGKPISPAFADFGPLVHSEVGMMCTLLPTGPRTFMTTASDGAQLTLEVSTETIDRFIAEMEHIVQALGGWCPFHGGAAANEAQARIPAP